MDELSPEEKRTSSRWEVLEEKGAPRGGLYELEILTRYVVRERGTSRIVLVREGLYEASYVDGDWGPATLSGVVEVAIDADDRHALVRDAEGRVERVALVAPPNTPSPAPPPSRTD